MDIAPTISAPSRLILTPGDKDLNGLVADIKQGILVTGFNGGNSNSSTGDFSYGIEGFLIEDGKLTQPVNEMNVTGNMVTLWNSLVAVGNDPQPNRSWQIPSLVFEGVVIGTDLLIGEMNAEFQFRMGRSIELQHGFGIDDACHAQKLAFTGSGRSENPDGREIQALADMLKQ